MTVATTSSSTYVDAAVRIARRLGHAAIWSGDRCTWKVTTPDRDRFPEIVAIQVPADGRLYAGTAGIGLLFTELHALTEDPEILRIARGAIDHALDDAEGIALNAFGFHAGRSGIAYAAARLAHLTGDQRYADAARAVLAPLIGREHEDAGFDVIAGGAGAIPVLLQIASLLDHPPAAAVARGLGENLIRGARRGPGGWSYPGARHHVRDLAGLAHGAAGVAHGLIELFAATGDDAYAHAAIQTFAYEASVFDTVAGNWPDFRHGKLGDILSGVDGIETLRRMLADGTLRRWSDSSMVAWCHGAPGIGLTRFRAFEVLGMEEYAWQGNLALEKTREMMPLTASHNYSLCHGAFGNSAVFLAGARACGNETWRAEAETLADEAIARFESAGVPWPSGTIGALPDPSLMLGDAGIAYHLLELADARVPSILLPVGPAIAASPGRRATSAPTLAVRPTVVPSRAHGLARSEIEASFGRSVWVFARLQPALSPLPDEIIALAGATGSIAATAYRTVIDRLSAAAADAELHARLTDASLPERTRHEAALGITDHTTELFDEVSREPVESVDWDRVMLRRCDATHVVTCEWDWDGWRMSSRGTEPPKAQRCHLVFRRANRARVRSVSVFAGAVLEAVAPAGSVDDVARRVAEALDEDAPLVGGRWDGLRRKVIEQLQHSWRMGVIRSVTI